MITDDLPTRVKRPEKADDTDAVAVGRPAPDFPLVVADRRGLRLRDLRGQPVVLAFFPLEWDPSRATQIQRYEAAVQDAGGAARFLSITCDGIWCDVDVADEAPLRFPMVTDLGSDGEIGALYGVSGRQAVFVLDGEGTVRWRHVGPVGMHASADDIVRAVEEALPKGGISRRRLLMTAVAATVAFTLLPRLARAEAQAASPESGRTISLHVNGRDHRVEIDPRVTLLDALRERLGLFGTKKGCDHGQCGACTVHLNGRRVNSCLTLAMQAEGARITTIEGLADGDRLHPVQAAFIKHDGFQCGYCTPGQIMSAVACIHEGHANSDEDIREFMSGNICRCGAYNGICAAVKEARAAMGGAS